jgi:uncharacterized protein (TIGR03437 family)
VPGQAADAACKPQAPCYSDASIVNAASNLPGIAAFTWVSLYGSNLSYTTRGRTEGDALPGIGGVNVLVNGQAAFMSYVSPLQVNFLMPMGLGLPHATVQIAREGMAGPAITVPLDDAAPALFQMDEKTAVAAHTDWTVVTRESPARAGQFVTVYATGLGQFEIPLDDLEIPQTANPIRHRAEVKLLLNGEPVPDERVTYVGAAPYFIGVYQINIKLPDSLSEDPEIQVKLGDRISREGVHLIAR